MADDNGIGSGAGEQGTRYDTDAPTTRPVRRRRRHPNERENPSNANRYAAAILRDLDDRIDRLENINREDAVPNILRADDEPVVIDDPVTVTTVAVDPITTALVWDDETATDTTWDGPGEWG